MGVRVLPAIRALAISATVVTIGGACSVAELASTDSVPMVVNACEEDTDCAGAAANAGICTRGICVASSGNVQAAFVEVTPPAVAFYGAGDSFLIPLEGLDHGRWDHDLTLPSYAEVEGMLTTEANILGQLPSEACEQAFDSASGSLRVHVELSRSDALHGLPALSVAANAELTNEGWRFAENVPPGRYDIYATALSGCDEDFPPVFVSGQPLEAGEVTLALHVGALSTLSGIVSPPAKGSGHVSLGDWRVSLVEPGQGRLISTTGKLGESNPTNFKLRYQPLSDVSPLLLLTPPEDVVAPEILWDLSALDLDGDGQVSPNLESLDTSTVRVRGTMVDANVTPVAGASVRLRSEHLLGAAKGLSARYEAVATSDEEGTIALDLLPGTYQVVVTPPDQTKLAVTETLWEIARTPPVQAGRTVALEPRQELRGSAIEPLGSSPLSGASVTLLPSTIATPDYLERALNPATVNPRVASAVTDSDGRFAIAVDPGRVDLSVKPSEASGFPWLVRARMKVPRAPLGEMPSSFPVPLAGTLRDPGDNLVQRALLRVFAMLDDDSPSGLARSAEMLSGDGVLQIAEGRTDESGDFVLLLPSRLLSE